MRTKSPSKDPKQARAAADLTQEQLAQKAGCSLATVARCERKRRFPIIPAVRRAYLAALNLPADSVEAVR